MYRTAVLTVVFILLCSLYPGRTDSAVPEEDISGTKLLKRVRRDKIQDRNEINTEFDTIIKNLALPDKTAREVQCLVKAAKRKFKAGDKKATLTKLNCALRKQKKGNEKVKEEIGRVEAIIVLINDFFKPH